MAEIGTLESAELTEKLAELGQQGDMDDSGAEPTMVGGGIQSSRTLLSPSGVGVPGVRRSLFRR